MKRLPLLLDLGLVALGIVVMMAFAQRWIYFPRYMARDLQEVSAPGLERWTLEAGGGRSVEAFFIPGEGVSALRPGPLVVFTHGNAEVIDQWVEPLAPYRGLGVSLLLPEFRGYGRSAGFPSQERLTRDALTFLDRARNRPDVDPNRVVYHGRSIGGGVACSMVVQRPPRALVLQSTFTSLADRAHEMTLLPRFLVADPFDNRGTLATWPGPVALFHGTRDTLIPYEHAVALQKAAKNARLHTYDSDHNDLPMEDRYWGEIRTFLQEAGVLAPAGPTASEPGAPTGPPAAGSAPGDPPIPPP